MSKKLNEISMQSELSSSAFFKPPAKQEDAAVESVKAPISAKTSEDDDNTTSLPEQEPKNAEQTETETTKKPSNEPTNERRNVRFNKREKIRHTFDIYKDQLLSLRQIALAREATFGERVLLGDIVQEALDMFITKERNKE